MNNVQSPTQSRNPEVLSRTSGDWNFEQKEKTQVDVYFGIFGK